MTVNDDDRGAMLAKSIAKEFGNPDHARVQRALVEFADSHHVVLARQKDDPHVLAAQIRQTRADQVDDIAWCRYRQAFVSRSEGNPPTEFEGSPLSVIALTGPTPGMRSRSAREAAINPALPR